MRCWRVDASRRGQSQASRRQRLTQLHVAYGNALFATRGSGVVGFPTSSSPVAIRYDRFTSSPAVSGAGLSALHCSGSRAGKRIAKKPAATKIAQKDGAPAKTRAAAESREADEERRCGMARRGGQSRSPVRALSRPAAIRYRLLEGDSHAKGIRTHGCAFRHPTAQAYLRSTASEVAASGPPPRVDQS
jgi:hypothetical protein